MYIGIHVMYQFGNLNLIDRLSKSTQMSNFIKIRLVGAEFPADGHTDMTKLMVVFR